MIVDKTDLTNELTLTWILRPGALAPGASAGFLQLCREHLAASVPVKFGTTEPLPGLLGNDGDDAFDALWHSAPLTHWRASSPFGWGAAAGFDDADGLRYIKIDCDSAVLSDSKDARSVRQLFIEVSVQLDCFYADISVARQARRTPNGLQSPAIENHSIVQGRKWRGLPIGDVWLAYFGQEYHHLIEPYLDVSPAGEAGALHEFPNAWIGDERRDDATFVGVLPDELLATCVGLFGKPVGRDKISAGIGVEAAATIPAGLITP